MAKTTVVIPNYNGIKYMDSCLKSLLRCKNQDFHIIIVDNASTDGSYELIQEQYPFVELIRNDKNEGFSKAVNQGILACKTPYVCLLNNDTEVEPDFLTELERVLDENPKAFSAGAKMISLHDQTKIDDAGDYYCALGWPFARGKGKNPNAFQQDDTVFAACAGAAVYRRSVFDEIGLFDENHFAYFEDIDVGYRARIYGFQNRFASKAIVYHAGSATSGSRYNEFKTNLASRNSIYLIYKNMPFLQILINMPFFIPGYLVKTLFFVKKGLGACYVRGIGKGFVLSASEEGRKHKVRFHFRNFGHYCTIQWELWKNIILLLKH